WLSDAALAVPVLALCRTPAPPDPQPGGRGPIRGTVLDPPGAVPPGAASTATNVATGVATTRQATDAGVFVVSPLPPGEYRVTVTLEGFQTFVQEHVIVDALTAVGLNATMSVGGVTQEVVVNAEPAQLKTADARLGP